MFIKFLVLFVQFTSIIGGTELEYTFSDQADGWLKLYKVPLAWNDAKIRCDSEGSVLASPLAGQLRDAIKQHVSQIDGTISMIFTGVHAEFTNGDFHSIEGVILSSLAVPLLVGASIDYKSSESCIVWDTGYDKLRKVKCESKFPYVCYKRRTTAPLPVNTGLGTRDEESRPGKQPIPPAGHRPQSPYGTQPSQRTQPDQQYQPAQQPQPPYSGQTDQGTQPRQPTQPNQQTQPDPRYQPAQQPQPPYSGQTDQGTQPRQPTQPNQQTQLDPRYQPAQQPQPPYSGQTDQGTQPRQPTQPNQQTQPDPRYQPAQQPQPPYWGQTNQGTQPKQPTQPNQRTQPDQQYQPTQQPQPPYWGQTNKGTQPRKPTQPNQRTQPDPQYQPAQQPQPDQRYQPSQQPPYRPQTDQRTQPNQRPYEKCTVDGANLIIINSDLQSDVLQKLVNYPAVMVIFADTAYIESGDGSSARVVVQRRQQQHQGVILPGFNETAIITPIYVKDSSSPPVHEGTQFNVHQSAPGYLSGTRNNQPNYNGVLTNPSSQLPATPKPRRRPLSYSWQTGWYMKMHHADTWNAALNRCASEGAILASPLTTQLSDAIKAYVLRVNRQVLRIYTGVHANFSNGDFYSIEGVSLTKMPVSLDSSANVVYDNTESCIVMNTFNTVVASVRCTERNPYVCLKKRTVVRGCGTRIQGYIYEPGTESCYKFHNKGQTWTGAYNTCKNEGGYLAIINSKRESVAMRNLFAKNPGRTISGYYPDSAYIGFRDWLDGKSWVTVKGKSLPESGYIGWASTEPNNANGNENCGTFNRNGFIFDDPCELNLAFICEKDSELLDSNPNLVNT